MTITKIPADSLVYIRQLSVNSIDTIITDPPYDIDPARMNDYHQEFLRICKGDILIFCSPNNQWSFPGVQWLFWVKPTSTKNYSKRYGNFVEMIAWYKRGVEIWHKDLHWANYMGVWSDIATEKLHPFVKPESLIEKFIKIHTDLGNTILDPFCGSGTVLKVAERLGRNAIGVEVNPEL